LGLTSCQSHQPSEKQVPCKRPAEAAPGHAANSHAADAMQGVKTVDLVSFHQVEGKISVEQIMGLCQALGYFPSGMSLVTSIQRLCLKCSGTVTWLSSTVACSRCVLNSRMFVNLLPGRQTQVIISCEHREQNTMCELLVLCLVSQALWLEVGHVHHQQTTQEK